MKNKLIILLLGVLGVFLFTTCKKDPKLPIPALQSGVIPKLLKVDTKDATINFFDLAAFNGSFTVDTYYADKPTSIEIWVTFNGDKTKRALVQTVTSFPTTIDVTVASLSTLLAAYMTPADLLAGAYFKFYTVINMKDGSVNSAFDPNNANGLIIDNFYGGTGTGALHSVHISVNKATYGISVPSPQVFADWLWNPGYKNATLSNLAGTLDACTQNFSFQADLTVSAGSFGRLSYTCTKN